MYIIIAILLFGVLIALHELGHFIAAKVLDVKVNEFAIGMGPAIFSKQGRETRYSLRILPIGGFCALEGEDGGTEDPRSFHKKPIWKRLIILSAGSFMNFLLGAVIVLILLSGSKIFVTPVLDGFMEGFEYQGPGYLMAGDRIVSIDGERIYTSKDIQLFLSRSNGRTVDLVVKRNGEKISFRDFPLALREYRTEDGQVVKKYGLKFKAVEANFGEVLKNTWYESLFLVRTVRLGLTDLLTGAVGLRQLSGPVGIVAVINDVGEASETTRDAIQNVSKLFALIAVNLSIMNMLPIPALDGGRIFFMLVAFVIEKITRRKVNPKVESYIHGMGLVLILALTAFVMINDIAKLL